MTVLHEDYRLRITHEALPHPGTFIVIIHAHIERFDAASGTFLPVLDLEPWLLSYAHAVMLSSDGRTASDRRLLHLHAAWPIIGDPATGSGPDVDIAADSYPPPREGLYKTWIQFRHAGRIHTVPLAFRVKKPEE